MPWVFLPPAMPRKLRFSSQKNGERKRQAMKRSAYLEVKVCNQKLFNIILCMDLWIPTFFFYMYRIQIPQRRLKSQFLITQTFLPSSAHPHCSTYTPRFTISRPPGVTKLQQIYPPSDYARSPSSLAVQHLQ